VYISRGRNVIPFPKNLSRCLSVHYEYQKHVLNFFFIEGDLSESVSIAKATMSLTWKVSAIQEPPAASKKRNYPLLVFLSCVCSYSPVDKVTCLAALTVRILS
jgi:hypothetical protein